MKRKEEGEQEEEKRNRRRGGKRGGVLKEEVEKEGRMGGFNLILSQTATVFLLAAFAFVEILWNCLGFNFLKPIRPWHIFHE